MSSAGRRGQRVPTEACSCGRILKHAGGEFVDVTDVDEEPGEGEDVDVEVAEDEFATKEVCCNTLGSATALAFTGKVHATSIRGPK